MAHYAYLFMSRSHDPELARQDIAPTEDRAGRNILALGRYRVPVLWYSAYSAQDIQTVNVPLAEDPGDERREANLGPTLATTIEAARQRSLSTVLLGADRFYDEWLTLLEGVDSPFLHLDTADLWWLSTPQEFAAHLAACVRAFEHDRFEDWEALLAQADVPFDAASKAASIGECGDPGDALRGHQCYRRVPWEDR